MADVSLPLGSQLSACLSHNNPQLTPTQLLLSQEDSLLNLYIIQEVSPHKLKSPTKSCQLDVASIGPHRKPFLCSCEYDFCSDCLATAAVYSYHPTTVGYIVACLAVIA
jgi:hypothetical protein